MIARGTIISGSTGPIFAIFTPYESVLGADDRSAPLFLISQGMLQGNQFVALAFRNGMEYRYVNVRVNSINDASTLCKNFVTFRPVTPS